VKSIAQNTNLQSSLAQRYSPTPNRNGLAYIPSWPWFV